MENYQEKEVILILADISDYPSFIVVRTHIGYGSPHKQDTAEAHGEPLGEKEVLLTKERLGCPPEPTFHIPVDALENFRQAVPHGMARQAEWDSRFEAYAHEYPELAAEFQRRLKNELPFGWDLDGGLIPYGATILIFSDYMRPPMRLAAMGKIGVIYVFTHDGIGLGEDGPTHQAVEQLLSLRAIPNFLLIRPADANGTAAAWRLSIEHWNGPVALVPSRQNLPVLDPQHFPHIHQGVLQGGYVLTEAPSSSSLDLILAATGSEVALALKAQETLSHEGVAARVVSLPCWNLFQRQPETYRKEVKPANVPVLVLETGVSLGWQSYLGAGEYNPDDDYPDFVVPLARAVAQRKVERGLAICGSGVGASITANKIPGGRAALITEVYSARQGVEDDDMNIMCLGGRVTSLGLAWELVQVFLQAQFNCEERYQRRLDKVAKLEKFQEQP